MQRKDFNIVTQILPWGITPWCVNTEKEKGIYGEIMQRNQLSQGKFDISVQIQLPNEWDPALANFNIGVTAGVETDKCSKEWATTHREKMNLLIVPSSHTKMTILGSGTGKEKTPIVVIPEFFFDELAQEVDDQPFEFSTSKNLLTIGMFTADDPSQDRKNFANTVKWFCQEFDGEDVGLIVKASKGRETTIDRELVRKTLKQIVETSGCKNPPKVYMLHGTMTRNEMNALYRHPTVKGFISSTRGEGFGLPMLESAIAGLPIVCTNWSSVIEFLSGPSFLGVNFDLQSIPQSRIDGNIFVQGAKWANPRESSFKKKIRKLIDENDQLTSDAKVLSKILIDSHNKEAIFKKYDETLRRFISQ